MIIKYPTYDISVTMDGEYKLKYCDIGIHRTGGDQEYRSFNIEDIFLRIKENEQL